MRSCAFCVYIYVFRKQSNKEALLTDRNTGDFSGITNINKRIKCNKTK